MKTVFFFSVILFILTGQTLGQETAPFSLTHFGHFKKMIHLKQTDGVVNLQKEVGLPHTYAVGAAANGSGEITVIDGKLWLDYGADGLGNADGMVSEDEEAVLLVRAQVAEWLAVKIPDDMQTSELQIFILDQAQSHGIDPEKPFPFMLEGDLFNVAWHVVNGPKSNQGGHQGGGIFKKIHQSRRESSRATFLGFYSAASQGIFTHPGDSWHLHILYSKEKMTAHLDAYSIREGALLSLPEP